MNELPPPLPPLLADALRRMARRYRAPELPASQTEAQAGSASTAMAFAIEHAREALAAGGSPGIEVHDLFLEALATLIVEAMRPTGDPAFQAMVLRHRSAVVREHASLSAHAERDRRQIRAAVSALAHPAKTQRRAAGAAREALEQLRSAADMGDWLTLRQVVTHLVGLPEVQNEPPLHQGLERLRDEAALPRLLRLEALSSDPLVVRYRGLWSRQGPSAGSEQAVERGAGAQRRGDAVEAQAAAALQTLVQRLNEDGGTDAYRVARSLRVPPSFPGDALRAKSEWDVALLRRADADEVWDVCLLVEAKASADAATTDLPRLLRGLRLLAQADIEAVYAFTSSEGEVRLRGSSLATLPTEEADLGRAVLYCCDGPVDRTPRLLNAASRMQLLSAEASLAFASRLEGGEAPTVEALEPVWRLLCEAPTFSAVLRQYPTLRVVREVMVHPEDFGEATGLQEQLAC